MAFILVWLRTFQTSSPLLSLTIGSLAAVLSFFMIWLLLPGGKEEFLGIISDFRSALYKRSKPLPTFKR
jgi:hypothetical protein